MHMNIVFVRILYPCILCEVSQLVGYTILFKFLYIFLVVLTLMYFQVQRKYSIQNNVANEYLIISRIKTKILKLEVIIWENLFSLSKKDKATHFCINTTAEKIN